MSLTVFIEARYNKYVTVATANIIYFKKICKLVQIGHENA